MRPWVKIEERSKGGKKVSRNNGGRLQYLCRGSLGRSQGGGLRSACAAGGALPWEGFE